MKALRVPVDGDVEIVDVDDTLTDLQQLVGGDIEVVRVPMLEASHVLVVNEEGLLHDPMLNPLGSLFYRTADHGHPIVGTIVILREKLDDDGEGMVFDGINEARVEMWRNAYQAVLDHVRAWMSHE